MKKHRSMFLLMLIIGLLAALLTNGIAESPDIPALSNQGRYVWFGTYKGDLILWRIVGENDNGSLLLSVNNLDDSIIFDDIPRSSNKWQGSKAHAWCRNFYESLTEEEQSLILCTTKEDAPNAPCGASKLDKDYVFFLSAEEFNNFRGYIPTVTSRWWLRSPVQGNDTYVGVVNSNEIGLRLIFDGSVAARPAFYMDLSQYVLLPDLSSDTPDICRPYSKDSEMRVRISSDAAIMDGNIVSFRAHLVKEARLAAIITDAKSKTILQYSEIQNTFNHDGDNWWTFALDPDKVSGTFNKDYRLYVMAINTQDGILTAGTVGNPVEIDKVKTATAPKPVPKTGDSSNPVLWIGLMLLGILGMCGVGVKWLRKR